MTSDGERAAIRQLAQAFMDEETERLAAVVEAVIGEPVRVRRPSVRDARLRDLIRMEGQAAAFVKAMELIRRWIRPDEDVRLGDRLKVLPLDEVEEIRRWLGRAGVR